MFALLLFADVVEDGARSPIAHMVKRVATRYAAGNCGENRGRIQLFPNISGKLYPTPVSTGTVLGNDRFKSVIEATLKRRVDRRSHGGDRRSETFREQRNQSGSRGRSTTLNP
jgi:hypothetical protein